MTLELGYYLNAFEISVPKVEVDIMSCDRSKFRNLRELRDEIKGMKKEIFVYAPGESSKVYGYGKDMDWLKGKDFELEKVNLYDIPRLTGRMCLEGVIIKALQMGYTFLDGENLSVNEFLDLNGKRREGRITIYNKDPKITKNGNVKVFIGCDMRVIFLRDFVDNELIFALIVDINYSLRDKDNEPLNFRSIVSKYGSNTLKEVRTIQKDLIPTGMNKEVSKQKFHEDILPFVERIEEIELPCDLKAKISKEPCRIILGGKQ